MIAELEILAGLVAVAGAIAFPLRMKAKVWWWTREPRTQEAMVLSYWVMVVWLLWRVL